MNFYETLKRMKVDKKIKKMSRGFSFLIWQSVRADTKIPDDGQGSVRYKVYKVG